MSNFLLCLYCLCLFLLFIVFWKKLTNTSYDSLRMAAAQTCPRCHWNPRPVANLQLYPHCAGERRVWIWLALFKSGKLQIPQKTWNQWKAVYQIYKYTYIVIVIRIMSLEAGYSRLCGMTDMTWCYNVIVSILVLGNQLRPLKHDLCLRISIPTCLVIQDVMYVSSSPNPDMSISKWNQESRKLD